MSEGVDQDDRRYRVRRQRRSAIVIVVVLLGLGGAFYYASTYFRDTAPKPTPCTTAAPVVPLEPADVSLNVYNSTSRRGLAAAVAKTATERGFKVKTVGNDPLKATIAQTAQIRFGSEGAASAELVQSHVPQSVLVDDKRKGDTIDLVVGQGWKSFGKVPVVPAPTQTLRQCPTETAQN